MSRVSACLTLKGASSSKVGEERCPSVFPPNFVSQCEGMFIRAEISKNGVDVKDQRGRTECQNW